MGNTIIKLEIQINLETSLLIWKHNFASGNIIVKLAT